MSEYTENNNHRHLSHLYAAWPAYETQTNPALAKAANKALDNRNKYNTTDATAGHGWMHKALVEARLKRGDGMMESLLKMMNGIAYYSSLMTDHDTNRRNDTYCTDTAFGTVGAINEALAFSNTGEIEIIPALPTDWTKGSVSGLMARTQAEISNLSWDTENMKANAEITSFTDDNSIRLSCGKAWTAAYMNGNKLDIEHDANGKYVTIVLNSGDSANIDFTLTKPSSIGGIKELKAHATAPTGNPEYTTDKNPGTIYTISDQTADKIQNQYIQFELNGKDTLDKIVLKKTVLPGEKNYWADWCLGVGCELQGSFDGENWETIVKMNENPDGTDNMSEEIFELEQSKAYKYVRYIRTKIKSKSDYAGWKWSDFGNRISLADIEFYNITPYISAEITEFTDTDISVYAKSTVSGTFNMITAVYSDDDYLASSVITSVTFEKNVPIDLKVNIDTTNKINVFFWQDDMQPVSEKILY